MTVVLLKKIGAPLYPTLMACNLELLRKIQDHEHKYGADVSTMSDSTKTPAKSFSDTPVSEEEFRVIFYSEIINFFLV